MQRDEASCHVSASAQDAHFEIVGAKGMRIALTTTFLYEEVSDADWNTEEEETDMPI